MSVISSSVPECLINAKTTTKPTSLKFHINMNIATFQQLSYLNIFQIQILESIYKSSYTSFLKTNIRFCKTNP